MIRIIFIRSRLDGLKHRARVWLLIVVVLGLGDSLGRAQSLVTVRVETERGAMVSDVKVLVKKLKSMEDHIVLQTLDVPETETGRYEIERLRKGIYEFLACDKDLLYKPDAYPISLDDNESKKFTLVLGDEKLGKLVIQGVSDGTTVCLRHQATGCEATKQVVNGSIPIRGPGQFYNVVIGECKKE